MVVGPLCGCCWGGDPNCRLLEDCQHPTRQGRCECCVCSPQHSVICNDCNAVVCSIGVLCGGAHACCSEVTAGTPGLAANQCSCIPWVSCTRQRSSTELALAAMCVIGYLHLLKEAAGQQPEGIERVLTCGVGLRRYNVQRSLATKRLSLLLLSMALRCSQCFACFTRK